MKIINKLLLNCILIFIFYSVKAQPEKVDLSVITKIKDEAFNHSKVMDILFNLSAPSTGARTRFS